MKTKVALFVNGWNGENVDSFIEGFNGYFADGEVDLFIFTSYSQAGTDDRQRLNDAENSIYSLPDISFFDVVVIFGSGLKGDHVISNLVNKCNEVGVPVILQGSDSDEVSSVVIDAYVGMKDLCNHLIEEHNVKNVTFIAGTADNMDSNYRMDVLKEALEEHGLSFTDENIFYANWDPIQINKYLNDTYFEGKAELPDAFVCANDQMAIFTTLFLDQMGHDIPDDVIVTGFDNLNDGQICYPALATVDQGYREQGRECAKLALELVKDKKLIKKSVVPCTAIFGESCGCMNRRSEAELRKHNGRIWTNERYISDNWKIRENEFDMLFMLNDRYEDIHQSMSKKFLTSVGAETDDFHVYLNPQYENLEYLNAPEDIQETYYNPVMDVICARTDGVIRGERTLDTKNLILGYNADDKGKTYVFRPLIVDSSVAGYMVMRYTSNMFSRRSDFDFSNSVGSTLTKFQRNISDYKKTEKIQEQADQFLRQTVEALATAVDAKDAYTHGHSNRVAKYSRKIAKEAGLTESECAEVYLAGLLHDVGKIGIDDRIINKTGKLTDEEFTLIKQHPVYGGQILSKIPASPSLSVGARFHHERYDGRGYPERLKADDIPRIARIIAVADAYDAMTSGRSYRGMLPRESVREELVKGIGTQFDPEYARIMLKFLDEDVDYTMREHRTEEVVGSDLSYEFNGYKTKVSVGIHITDCPVSLKFKYVPLKNGGQPTLLFYDSADERYYLEDGLLAKEMDFIDYVSVDMTGNIDANYVRQVAYKTDAEETVTTRSGRTYIADVFAVKQEDHLFVRVTTEGRTNEFTFAMHDASRYIYMALTGEFCTLDILGVDISDSNIEENFIPRIVEKVSYIDSPAGDIPNVQIDGWLSNHSEAMKLDSDIALSFHSMSLPSSKRIWHCPIVALYTSDDGKIGGANYKEIAFVRLDGSVWCSNSEVINEPQVEETDKFENWGVWKKNNKAGVDCKLALSRKGDTLELQLENSGLETQNITKLPEDISDVYLYLTGDQCALTNIRITNN